MTDVRRLDRQGAVLIGVSVLALGLVAGLVAWRQLATPALDPVTLRAAGQPVAGEVIVVLDATDPLSPPQLTATVDWLREYELTHLHPNEHLTVWVLGTSESGGLMRVFAKYYPGREADPIMHNPAASAARCDLLFSGPLRAAVERSARGQRSPRSPILQSLREIAQQPEFIDSHVPRHLVLISDLLQHTRDLNFYDAVPSFAALQRAPQFPALRASLHGVAVDVLYLPRNEIAWATSTLTDFWRDYLTGCGACPVRLRRL